MSNQNVAVLSTSAQINAFRLMSLRAGLMAEIRGMRLTSKGRTCYAIIKSERGFKGSKVKVYAQYLLWLEEQDLLTITDEQRGAVMNAALGR